MLNFDPFPWDLPGGFGNSYKNFWKCLKPFKGSFEKVTAEGFDPGKFIPKINDGRVKEMVDAIRPHATKSHVQNWAIDSYLDFIDSYMSLAQRQYFSYGYVWELKCQYLQQLYNILDKGLIKDAQYALYQTGPTWTLIFDGNEIVGLERAGFKYINFLIQHPNESYLTSDLDSLIASPESVQEKEKYKGLHNKIIDHLSGSSSSKTTGPRMTKEDKKRYLKEMEDLKEYRATILKHEEMEAEEPGSSDINPILLKEAKEAVGRILKDLKSKTNFGGVVYEKKEMIKKEQQRISKRIERAVKEIEKYDTAAFEHFLEALSPINTKMQCYGTSKNIKWETK